MSDIVWAINPQKDSLHEMVRRMRRFANEVLPARGITFTIAAPEGDVRLGADERRHIYLIFKEALNNVLRHADATAVAIELRLANRKLHLEITDNGRGYRPPPVGAGLESDGNGLISMARRAKSLGGAFGITKRDSRGGRSSPRRFRWDGPPERTPPPERAFAGTISGYRVSPCPPVHVGDSGPGGG